MASTNGKHRSDIVGPSKDLFLHKRFPVLP